MINPLTYCAIDLAAICYNFRILKQLAAKNYKGKGKRPKILAVVKADGYGHGMVKVARALDQAGADVLGVSNVVEGIALRQAGIKKSILLFENSLPEFAPDIVKYRLTPMLCTMELARALNAAAQKAKQVVDLHIKIDTGMGRLGVWQDEAAEFVMQVNEFANLRVSGIATHFPAADSDESFTKKQLAIFESIFQLLPTHFQPNFYIHAANSAGLASSANWFCNLARPGLMLYGLYPNAAIQRRIKLKPVMSIKTRVIFIKDIKPGRSISYGRTFIARRLMKVATLAIGYSDGYFRCLSGKAQVLIGGKRCAQLGRVTMDQIMVDVSQVKNVKLGQEAVILGRQGSQKITAEELAKWAGTINYEIVCNLGNRLPRVYSGK